MNELFTNLQRFIIISVSKQFESHIWYLPKGFKYFLLILKHIKRAFPIMKKPSLNNKKPCNRKASYTAEDGT